mmetsp:Transcript_839/g.2113  ORF Transcript_839/g.2113 Transcript_839/m.2113 type:complete len:239 (-) Transcript_839:142-858(-)
MGISSSGLYLEDSFFDGQEGNIEGTSSQVENKDVFLVSLLVQTVGDGGCSRFVDNTKDVEPRDGSGVLGRLTLTVVKVSRNGDNSVPDFLAQVSLGNVLHLGENHGADFLGLEGLLFSLVFDLDDGGTAGSRDDSKRPVLHVGLDGSVGELASDQSLGIEDGVGGVHGSLGFCGISDKTFGLGESNVRRCGTVTLVVGNDFDTVILPDTNTRVGGSKIDSNGLSSSGSHCYCCLLLIN